LSSSFLVRNAGNLEVVDQILQLLVTWTVLRGAGRVRSERGWEGWWYIGLTTLKDVWLAAVITTITQVIISGLKMVFLRRSHIEFGVFDELILQTVQF